MFLNRIFVRMFCSGIAEQLLAYEKFVKISLIRFLDSIHKLNSVA
jgi:hypothetical protein